MADLKRIFTVIYIALYLTNTPCDSSSSAHLIKDDPNLPCSYFDTVNITGSLRYPNGSYQYEDILIPPKYVGIYSYEFLTLTHKERVAPHLRGCVCMLKTCIKMCCGRYTEKYMSMSNESCADIYLANKTIEVTSLDDGDIYTVALTDKFAVQEGRPCTSLYNLDPSNIYDNYTIFENGTLLREDDMFYFNKDSYCLSSMYLGNSSNRTVVPLVCFSTDKQGDSRDIIYSYAMIFSIPFMMLTTLVYLIIPELRNIHGKSLCCYLFGLTVGYTILAFFRLYDARTLSDSFCGIVGFIAYFSFMASFFWLSVISFDLWWNFRGMKGINRFNERKRFIIYSLYAWGLAAVFLAITLYAQLTDVIPAEWKPQIGGEEFCWLNVQHGWSAMIYFFGPILIIISINLVLFVLTSLKIYNVQKEMAKLTAKDDSRKNLRNEKDRFGLFLRLFIVMGVTWLMEIISYFVGSKSEYAKFFYLSDICNAIQGFVIFALFVLKKKVKVLMTKRFKGSQTTSERFSQYSTKTTTSSINLSMNAMQTIQPNHSERPLLKNK